MSAYTPGPWSAQHPQLTQRGAQISIYAHKPGGGVRFGVCQLVSMQKKDNPQTAANARLIAAAPDLLEALEELVDICVAPGQSMTKALKAINKAKGATT